MTGHARYGLSMAPMAVLIDANNIVGSCRQLGAGDSSHTRQQLSTELSSLVRCIEHSSYAPGAISRFIVKRNVNGHYRGSAQSARDCAIPQIGGALLPGGASI